jgi:hypothetical protein
MTSSLTTHETANEITQAETDPTESDILDTIFVTYDTRVTRKEASAGLRQLSWIIQEIQSSDRLKQAVTTIRETEADARADLKKKLLPYFTFLRFRNNVRKAENFQEVQFIILDVDHISDRLERVKGLIRSDAQVFMSFTSPSGDGLKIVFRLESPVADAQVYETVYQSARQMIKDRYGVETDNISDVARACFLSYDPEIHVNIKAIPLPVSASSTAPKTQSSAPTGDDLMSALQGTEPGGRTAAMTKLIGVYIDRGFTRDVAVEHIRMWNTRNDPPHSDEKLVSTVHDMYGRYDKRQKMLPVQFRASDNCYFKQSRATHGPADVQVSTFIVEPEELLVLPDNDSLICTVHSSLGNAYTGITIESSDWHNKQKLLKAIGHSDCVWVGSDNDLQALCAYIASIVPKRKIGVRVIGLHDGTWVSDGLNITSSGISYAPDIIPYDKGTGAFCRKIAFAHLPDAEYKELVRRFYADICGINRPTVIFPLIGWLFASPMKEAVRKHLGSFPSALIHGGQGSGKTSTAKMFMRLFGYKNPVPNKCDMKPFPMLKNLSSTNGIPQFYDEFKQSDMKTESVDSLMRYIREIYDGEMELKGREDQTTVEYELLAPIAVLGEWNINQPAIRERALMIRFDDSVKKQKQIRDCFASLLTLSLEGFMPRYIQFCLQQDIPGILRLSVRYLEEHFSGRIVAPRILNNLAVMLLGLVLFQDYAQSCGLSMPRIEPESILDHQLQEISGTQTGMVRSSVDQLIEELGFMWQKNEKQLTYTTSWWTTATIDDSAAIAIRFNKVFPEFKEYAQRTRYEGDLLDKESYLRLFRECDYVIHTSHPVSFDGVKQRCLCFGILKALEAGIDLEGFGVTDSYGMVTERV